MNNNPIEMIKLFLGQNKKPEELLQKMVNDNNPILNNLINMARSGDSKGVENFARNLYKDQGRDFDKEFSEFMSNFKGIN